MFLMIDAIGIFCDFAIVSKTSKNSGSNEILVW